MFQAYLDQYPSGAFATIARLKQGALGQANQTAALTPRVAPPAPSMPVPGSIDGVWKGSISSYHDFNWPVVITISGERIIKVETPGHKVHLDIQISRRRLEVLDIKLTNPKHRGGRMAKAKLSDDWSDGVFTAGSKFNVGGVNFAAADRDYDLQLRLTRVP